MTTAIFQLVLLFLKLADKTFSYLHDQNLIAEGEQRQYARATLEMAARTKVFQQIEAEYAKMPIADVIKQLDGDFRD